MQERRGIPLKYKINLAFLRKQSVYSRKNIIILIFMIVMLKCHTRNK